MILFCAILISLMALPLCLYIARRRRLFFPDTPKVMPDLVLVILALAALVAAIALFPKQAPQTGQFNQAPTVFFAIDTSRSMLADHDGKSRLHHAKLLAHGIADSLDRTNLAIISFAGSTMLDFPPSRDKTAFFEALEQLQQSNEDIPGSNPAAAIQLAQSIANDLKLGKSVLCLLTDGELQAAPDTLPHWSKRTMPTAFACIGIGSPKPIPLGQLWMKDPETGEIALTNATTQQLDSLSKRSQAPWETINPALPPKTIARQILKLAGEAQPQQILDTKQQSSRVSGILAFFAAIALALAIFAKPKLIQQVAIIICLATAFYADTSSPLNQPIESQLNAINEIKKTLANNPNITDTQRAQLLANWAELLATATGKSQLENQEKLENLKAALELANKAQELLPDTPSVKHNISQIEKQIKTLQIPQDAPPEQKSEGQEEKQYAEPTQQQSTIKHEHAPTADTALQLPNESTSVPDDKADNSSSTPQKAPGTWRELKRQNRNIKATPKSIKPW